MNGNHSLPSSTALERQAGPVKWGVASIQNTNAQQGNGIFLIPITHIFCVLSVMLHCLSHGSRNPGGLPRSVSGVEDPERKPAKMAGFRGGRYISVEASARGEWETGGSKMPGGDAYATSKQCILAAAMVFARETPRLRFNALEPGFTPNTGLGREANAFLRFLANYLLPLLAPHLKYWSTPKKASRVSAEVLINTSGQTGIYYDENAHPMLGSSLVRDTEFQDRVVAETRALLSTIQA
jgi:hypothetical protein